MPHCNKGGAGKYCGRGVLANILTNTPLHPSQEGNRTTQAQNTVKLIVFKVLKISYK